MTAAEDSYAAAEAEIEKARAEGTTELDLAKERFAALDRLPASLETLIDLEELRLGDYKGNTQVTDITSLSGLTGLQTLWLENTPVTELTAVSGLTGLQTLWLNGTPVTELTALSGLTGLQGLYLANTPVTDLTALSGLTGLQGLSLANTPVTDLTALSGLTGLQGLWLANTPVTDLTALSGLTGLQGLYLNNTPVTELTALSGLTGLQTLRLDNTPVTELRALSGLTGLHTLDLDNTPVTELTALSGLTGLQELWLNGTPVTELTALSGLTGLQELWLNGTPVTDLTALSGLTGLQRLDLNDTPVTVLRPLRSLTKLAEDPALSGLTFTNSAATRTDPRLAEIAGIEDQAERARTLFEYLEDWEPPVPSDQAQSPAFVLPDDGPMRSVDEAPEGGDADQEALQADLSRKTVLLIEAIGGSNEYAGLKAAAEHYRTQIDKPLSAIRLRLLYSAANTLRTAYEANAAAEDRGRQNDELPPAIAAPLKDVVETHALFFTGFPNAAAVHQQMLDGLTGGRNREEVALADPLVKALEDKPEVLDPEDQAALEDDLAAAQGEGASAEIGEKSLTGKLWNMFSSFGRKVIVGGTTLVFGHYFIQWVVANEAAILAWLKAAQGTAYIWFPRVMEIIREAMKVGM